MTARELAMNLIDNDRDGTTFSITTAEAAAILADFRCSDEEHDLDGITAEDLAAEFNALWPAGAELAFRIRSSESWDLDLLAELCRMAGMSAEWEAADGESFESVAYAAAEKLGVEIKGGKSNEGYFEWFRSRFRRLRQPDG